MSLSTVYTATGRLEEIRQKLQEAIQKNDAEQTSAAFEDLFQHYADVNRQEYELLREETDVKVLASRGVRQLTTREREYYQKLGEAMNAKDPRQAVNNLDVVMPGTVFNSIFDDLETDHPLLKELNFTNTEGAIRILMNTNGFQMAAWGKLCGQILQELSSGFKEVKTDLNKLSGFLPICKAQLDLGPEWLDRYIRRVLLEALANGMENGVVNGTGNDEPIGMNRQVGENVTTTGGVYPEKVPVKLTRFSPSTMGNLVSILAASPTGKARRVTSLILVVNPQDYFEKVMPATTVQAPDGTFRNDVFPYPVKVIQSAAKKKGRATLGIGRLYWAFVGMSKDGRIEYSDEYHFLEDERVYLIKTYANGMPADNNAFIELDITDLEPAKWEVVATEKPAPSSDAALADLRMGNLSLSPIFDGKVASYTASTTNATNTITAIPDNAAASVKVTVNDVEIDNGTAASWNNGENTVKAIVTAEDGKTTKTYAVTVTKTNP